MPCKYFLLIRRQRRPCLLAIDDGLSLAGQHAGRDCTAVSGMILSHDLQLHPDVIFTHGSITTVHVTIAANFSNIGTAQQVTDDSRWHG